MGATADYPDVEDCKGEIRFFLYAFVRHILLVVFFFAVDQNDCFVVMVFFGPFL